MGIVGAQEETKAAAEAAAPDADEAEEPEEDDDEDDFIVSELHPLVLTLASVCFRTCDVLFPWFTPFV